MVTPTTTLVNGAPGASVSVHDRGFQYGDGAFETIAVYRGEPLLWDRHIVRLERGLARLGIASPATNVLRTEAERLCHGVARAVLKLVVTRGVGGRGYAAVATLDATRVLILNPWPDYPAAFTTEGVAVRLCSTILGRNPRLAGIKHMGRLEQVLARAELGAEHAEGLVCDADGDVIEATMSNVFAVIGGSLVT